MNTMRARRRTIFPLASTNMSRIPPDKPVPFGNRNAVASGRRRRDRLELSVAYGLILLAIWTPPPEQELLSLAALAWVLLATRLSFDGWSTLGMSSTGFLRSLWVVGAAFLLAFSAGLLASRLQTLHTPAYAALFVKRCCGYAIWAFLQEFLLLGFFLLRLLRLLPDRKTAMMAAACMFAVVHLPNPILTVLTLLWGWVSCQLFLRYRNLYTLAMAHAILGTCLAITIPGPVVHHMRVGLGYLTYPPPPQRSQKDQIVSTPAWVSAEAPTRRSWRQARP